MPMSIHVEGISEETANRYLNDLNRTRLRLFGKDYHTLHEHAGEALSIVDERDALHPVLVYLLQYRVVDYPALQRLCIEYVNVYREFFNLNTVDVTEWIIHKLLGQYRTIVLGTMEAVFSNRFLGNRIGDAFFYHQFVYYVDTSQSLSKETVIHFQSSRQFSDLGYQYKNDSSKSTWKVLITLDRCVV